MLETFAIWRRQRRAALRDDRESDVACGTCSTCVPPRSSSTSTRPRPTHWRPSRASSCSLRHGWQPAPYSWATTSVGAARCWSRPLLVEAAAIYAHRPRACRTYLRLRAVHGSRCRAGRRAHVSCRGPGAELAVPVLAPGRPGRRRAGARRRRDRECSSPRLDCGRPCRGARRERQRGRHRRRRRLALRRLTPWWLEFGAAAQGDDSGTDGGEGQPEPSPSEPSGLPRRLEYPYAADRVGGADLVVQVQGGHVAVYFQPRDHP